MKVKEIELSVIMSVYNSEKPEYLDTALSSVWSQQKLKPDEIILIEDGPLNESLCGVIDAWQQLIGDKLVIIKNETNLGLTKSLNKGISKARGRFVVRMDSDDISHPDRLHKQYAYMLANPDIDVLGGSIQEFNSTNECLNIRKYPKTHADVLRYLHKASPLAHPATMIRKSIFDSGLRYNENYRTSQDLALWFDVIYNGGKIANLDDVVLYFRREESIYKRRGRNKALNEFKIYVNGVRKIYGIASLKYCYPFARLIFRLMPTSFIRWIYSSRCRNFIIKARES